MDNLITNTVTVMALFTPSNKSPVLWESSGNSRRSTQRSIFPTLAQGTCLLSVPLTAFDVTHAQLCKHFKPERAVSDGFKFQM